MIQCDSMSWSKANGQTKRNKEMKLSSEIKKKGFELGRMAKARSVLNNAAQDDDDDDGCVLCWSRSKLASVPLRSWMGSCSCTSYWLERPCDDVWLEFGREIGSWRVMQRPPSNVLAEPSRNGTYRWDPLGVRTGGTALSLEWAVAALNSMMLS